MGVPAGVCQGVSLTSCPSFSLGTLQRSVKGVSGSLKASPWPLFLSVTPTLLVDTLIMMGTIASMRFNQI